ncbi:hypothetical protein EGH25_02705 [Haladaptatus sp. F3-133]|uniref:Uncharacterized protein n=1 Tax=Halorutilus salinus TaxID=2487751 RepID=A0A9Q4C1L5_9EURY|nr:hypothetical protein [Halorutilus salinus]
MSSGAKKVTDAADEDTVSLREGEQSVCPIDAMDDPLRQLPPETFERMLVVSTRGDPERVERAVRDAGADPTNVVVVPVSGSAIRYDGPLTVGKRVAPSDMTGVGVRFTEALRGFDEPAWVVVDNFNVFLMYTDQKRVYRFMDSLTGKARESGARGLYCTVRDALTDTTYQTFRNLFDSETDLR